MNNLTKTMLLIRPYWRYLVQATLGSLVLIVLQLPTPYITKVFVDSVFPNQDVTLLGFLVIIQMALAIFNSVFGAMRGYFELSVGLRMSLDVGKRFFRHLEGLSFSFFDDRRTGELISRFGDAHAAINATIGLFSGVFLSVTQLCVFPIVLLIFSWKLTVLALLVYPFDVIVYRAMNRRLYRHGKAVAERRAEFQAKLYETLAGIRTVQALGEETRAEDEVRKHLVSIAEEQLRLSRASQGGNAVSAILRAIGNAVFLWFGWRFVISGEMTLGTFMAFSLYLGYLSGPIHQLFTVSQQLQQALVHTGRFFEVYEVQAEIKDSAEGTITPPPGLKDIRFVGVRFRYGQGPVVLQDIDLQIKAGTTTAIVGRSGAGKTTLVNLVPRFYDPTSGWVEYGGHDLKEFQVSQLRRQISYVMQRSSFFYGSIYNEITMGNGRSSMEKVEAAAEKANIRDFVLSLPRGFETHLGEAGVGISEGQRQRIALARAFLQDRPILILDESTSSLDYQSEIMVKRSLEELRVGRTMIIVAHRLSTIEQADQVVVMDAGRIVEMGRFDDLIDAGGAFGQLYHGLARV